MSTSRVVFGVVLSGFVLASAANELQREMNVTQGPETVFDRLPAEVLPALTDAAPTGENGRVGNELVFWGYEQTDGRRVFFFACAQLPDVDCDARVHAICPAGGNVLEAQQTSGTIVERSCRSVTVVSPGGGRPGCADRTASAGLLVGLVSCN